MSQAVVIPELGIIIAVNNHQPTVLTPEFLKYSGIVPSEWELAQEPICTNNVAQVIYTNGVNLVAEPSRVMFIEPILNKEQNSISVPSIARKYMEILPNAQYEGIGIAFKGYVTFDKDLDAGKYLTETLLNRGAWQSVGNEPVRTGLHLSYSLDGRQLVLSINEARLKNPDETTNSIVIFNGNFSYNLANNTLDLRLAAMHQALANWQVDLATYTEIVNTKFFGEAAQNISVVPDLFRMGATV